MAHASALLERAEALTSELCDPKTRYTDFLVQFREVDRVDGEIVPTGRVSAVYGWRWDRDRVNENGTVGGWADLDEIDDADVSVDDANPAQFEILCDDDTEHILVYGSRGSSKSELGARWKKKRIAMAPKKALSLLVAKRKKARRFVEKKMLPLLPQQWLSDGAGNKGKKGYRKSQDEIALSFKHGAMLDCLSAQVVDDARGDDQVSALIDESQLCPAEARENLILSGRDNTGCKIQTLETATLLAGEFEDYLEECRADPTYRIVELSITDNVHLDTVYDEKTGCELPSLVIWARQHMDPERFRQEVGVWDAEAQRFRPQAAHTTGLVYHQYRKKLHVREFVEHEAEVAVRAICQSAEPGVGLDITDVVSKRKFRKPLDYLVGIDFVPPLAAVVVKAFSTPPGWLDLLWVVDEIEEPDINPTALAKRLRVAGYSGAGVIPDAAGRYSDGDKSSVVLVKKQGFDIRGPVKNPPDRDRINSVNAKLFNADDQVGILIDPKCKKLLAALKGQRLGGNGKEALMEAGEDSFARALGWLVTYHYPAKMREVA